MELPRAPSQISIVIIYAYVLSSTYSFLIRSSSKMWAFYISFDPSVFSTITFIII